MTPMPDDNTKWPHPDLDGISPFMRAWDAWYTGDPVALAGAYGNTQTASPQQRVRESQVSGGLVGVVGRAFWGKPRADLTRADEKRRHVPLPADIAQASADLLFSDPPKVTVTLPGAEPAHKPAQDRLDYLIDAGNVWDVLADAAEVQSALGGVFLRVWWDDQVADRAFLTRVDADIAVPVFKYDNLVEVTFFYEVGRKDNTVWRHAEHHALDGQGHGTIEHALFRGTDDTLGVRAPFEDHPAMTGLAAIVNENSAVSTLTPGLAVEYVPNLRPQRRWRKHPLGRSLGRSDFDGVEHLFDALDETFSEWVNEVIRSRNRILAMETVLDDMGPGRGAAFAMDRSVFTPVHALAPRDGNALPIEVVQFQVDVARYQATCQEQITTILRSCGYSAATFGEDETGAPRTATEVDSRDARTESTRRRKIRQWDNRLGRVFAKLLLVDAAFFPGGVAGDFEVKVTFPPSTDSPAQVAQTVAALRGAKAMSVETAVRMSQPRLDDKGVDAEVKRITDEEEAANPPLPDPAALTGADMQAPDGLPG